MGLWSSIVAVAGVVAAPFTGGASLALTAAALVAPKVVDKVVDFVMKPFLGMMGMPEMPTGGMAEAERQQGVLIQRQGSVVPIPVVYGFRKVADIVTFAETGATDNKYLWVAHVFAEGEVAGIKTLSCGDDLLPDSVVTRLNNGQIVDVDSGKYAGRMRLQFFPGKYFTDPTALNHPVRQFCFFNNDADKPPSWTTDMVYNGLAVMFARYEWKKVTTQADADSQPYGGSIPSLSIEMYGKLVSPVPASAPAEEYDGDSARYPTVTNSAGVKMGYSNPVECLLDYLRNPRYGKGLKNADIDWASWNIAATKASTEVTYANSLKGPILSLNFVLDTNNSIFNNVKAMLSNFRGYMPYVQGKYKLKIEDAGNPTDILSGAADIAMEFTKDDIMGDITYTGIERSSKFNQVVVTWVDPDNKWSNQEVVYPEKEEDRQYYIALDGLRENKGTFTASGITNPIMAKDIARIIFMKSRLSDSVSFTVSSKAIDLEPGDNIHIKGNILNFTDTVPWRVISTTLNNDMTVTLGCVYNPDSIYPYTRWGEPDKVLPVYVPKGAERYYPVVTPTERNGLVPPYPGKPWTINDPFSGLDDVILVTNISFVSLGTTGVSTSDNIYADITFNQPQNSQYETTHFYWKEDVASAKTWAEFSSTVTPGPNKPITVRVGPVVFGKTYALNSRVVYQSGQVSSELGAYTFLVSTQSITPTPPPGTVVTPPAPLPNAADNFMINVVGSVQVDGSNHPKSPRQIVFTANQDMTAGINSYLNSYEVFWKPSQLAKWQYARGSLSVPQGNQFTWTLTAGLPVYPFVPGSTVAANVDDYDFIFRFSYSDNKASVYQYRAMNCSVEWNGSSYSFNPLTSSSAIIYNKELSSAYVPQIAGPNDVTETREIKISSPYIIKDNGATAGIKIYFYPPVAADLAAWKGVRVYRHKAGTAGTGDYVSFTPVSTDTIGYYVTVTGITYDENWEFVLVPLVDYGNSIAEANYAQYMIGKLHNRTGDADYPGGTYRSWLPNFTVNAMEARATAMARIGTGSGTPLPHNNYLSTYASQTILASGVPSSPRVLQFSLKQSTATVSGHITAFVIYYKQSDAIYWKRSVYNLGAYTEGSTRTFSTNATTPVMDLGYPTYPNFPGREQNYDFVFRFLYDDGAESIYESAFYNYKIENTGTGTGSSAIYDFYPISAGTASYGPCNNLITEDKAPPGTVIDPRDILSSASMTALALETEVSNLPAQAARFSFGVPISTLKGYLAGFRIYRREVVLGSNPAFASEDNLPYKTGDWYNTTTYTNVPVLAAISTGLAWHKEYEFAIVPVVWYQGTKTEANKCLYWRGKLTNQYSSITSNPYVSNFFSRTPAQIITTTEAKTKLATAFPDDNPTVKMLSIIRTNAFGADLGYHTIKYQVPGSFVSATIYRRNALDYNGVTSQAYAGAYYNNGNFGGVGRWEKIAISNITYPITTNADGTKTQTVNLRPAISSTIFNSNYDPSQPLFTGSGINYQTLYRGYSNIEPGQTGANISKLYLAGDTAHNGTNQFGVTQLFIVVNYLKAGVNTLSTYGLRVDLYDYRTEVASPYRQIVNAVGNPDVDCTVVATADMEAPMDKSKLAPAVHASTPNMMRKMSDAASGTWSTPIPDSAIAKPGDYGWTLTYVKPTVVPPVI